MKLNEAAQVNTVNNEYVTLINANGNLLKINKADLAEVIRDNISVATTDKNGLYGKSYVVKAFATSSTDTKLIKLFSCKKADSPVRYPCYFGDLNQELYQSLASIRIPIIPLRGFLI